MADKQSQLTKARIVEVDEKGEVVKQGVAVECMFNPYEYSVTKTNTYERKSKNNSDVVHAEFKQAGSQKLKLKLFFDTFEKKSDVTLETEKLWQFMSVIRSDPDGASKQKQDTQKQRPPYVAFKWGIFSFVSVITDMTQTFTLFLHDGTPVRATVDVSFEQFNDIDDYHRKKGQNPTSGGGPLQKVRTVQGGDRLDLIAYEEYGDATLWRYIADANDLPNLHSLRAGYKLVIPDLSAFA